MVVLVVLGVVALALTAAVEARVVALWLLVLLADAVEGVDVPEHRRYADVRRIVTEHGVAGLDLAWGPEDHHAPTLDRADWQLRSS